MAYSEKVIDHYENPRNVGAFEKGDDSVGTGMVGAPACGDVMKLQIKVRHHNQLSAALKAACYPLIPRARKDVCVVALNV